MTAPVQFKHKYTGRAYPQSHTFMLRCYPERHLHFRLLFNVLCCIGTSSLYCTFLLLVRIHSDWSHIQAALTCWLLHLIPSPADSRIRITCLLLHVVYSAYSHSCYCYSVFMLWTHHPGVPTLLHSQPELRLYQFSCSAYTQSCVHTSTATPGCIPHSPKPLSMSAVTSS